MTNPGPASHLLTGSGAATSGGRQSVVELCGASVGGLVFWSRLRFETGADVQVRVRVESLPAYLFRRLAGEGQTGWVRLRGRVVECEALRREDGSVGFRVSAKLRAFPPTGTVCGVPPPPKRVFFQHAWLGGVRQGRC